MIHVSEIRNKIEDGHYTENTPIGERPQPPSLPAKPLHGCNMAELQDALAKRSAYEAALEDWEHRRACRDERATKLVEVFYRDLCEAHAIHPDSASAKEIWGLVWQHKTDGLSAVVDGFVEQMRVYAVIFKEVSEDLQNPQKPGKSKVGWRAKQKRS